MALIVEDGTGLSTAEAYCSTAYADTYHLLRGNTLWATMSTNEKEQALRRSADYMVQVYRSKWKGYRVNASQALDWPRTGVLIEDSLTGDIILQSTIVPEDIQRANAALSFNAAHGEMLPDVSSQNVVRKKVDVIEIEYDKNSTTLPIYRSINALLAPYMDGAGNSSNVSRAIRA